MTMDRAVLERHGLKDDEYARIVELLGREPNLTELGLFSVMWSEHCSYKSSRVHLRTLPTIVWQARSGCGIRPTTLRASLQIPAIELIEPFGLAASIA